MEKRLITSHNQSLTKIILVPIYETHKGWVEKTKGAKSWTELPALAIKYVRRIEELLGVQVSLLSTSPKREDTILVKNPFID